MRDSSEAFAPMPDPMAKWTPVPDWRTVSIVRPDWSARPVLDLSMALAVGQIASALAALLPDGQELGLWRIASSSDYAIRIARDKALIVTGAPLSFSPGWNQSGWSVTAAESAYGVIEIAGNALPDIVSEATAADIEAGSRSASVLFAGIPCLLVRASADVARVHLEIGYMAYLWSWLEMRT